MPDDIPEFGKAWAAEGETRPSQFRTPMAHSRGADGGVLFVRDGHGAERWMMLGEWLAWVKETKAAPVGDDAAGSGEQPWIDNGPEAA